MGIAQFTDEEFRARIDQFRRAYVTHWRDWIVKQNAEMLGEVLRKWQACRPNNMRRSQKDPKHQLHDPPFLEDLIVQAREPLKTLKTFDLSAQDPFSQENIESLDKMWEIFTELSYGGRANNGKASVVGISKATLLLTEGRVGPAFTSNNFGRITDSNTWVAALRLVSQDIHAFKINTGKTLQEAAPDWCNNYNSGRIYDMVFGPRE
jgi:hypothetical protein